MKCTDCKGSGIYQGLGQPEQCTRCTGSGVESTDTKLSGQRAEAFIFEEGPLTWDDASATPAEDFANAKNIISAKDAEAYDARRKTANRARHAQFNQKADVAVATIYDKYVEVVFIAAGAKPFRGRIVSVDTFGPYIQKIELDCAGNLHVIPILLIKKILDDVNGDQLWPTDDAPASAPPTTTTVVSTTIAGTAVKTGDSVDVTTDVGIVSARYVGILKAINADTIEVEAQHGVDTIPINVIDQIIVTSPVTHSAPPGSAINYASPRPIDPAEAARLRKLDEDGFVSHRAFPRSAGFAKGGAVKCGTQAYFNRDTNIWTTARTEMKAALLDFSQLIISKLVRQAVAKALDDYSLRGHV